MTLSAARRLARFVVDLELKDVPAPTVGKAGLLVLDTLGCCLAAARYDFGRAARATAERLGGPPESALVGSRVRVAAANAALANATLAHGLDFDDTREDAIVHTGSVAVTTSLAVGEATGVRPQYERSQAEGPERQARPHLPATELPVHIPGQDRERHAVGREVHERGQQQEKKWSRPQSGRRWRSHWRRF